MTCTDCHREDMRGRAGIWTLCASCYELAVKSLDDGVKGHTAITMQHGKLPRLSQCSKCGDFLEHGHECSSLAPARRALGVGDGADGHVRTEARPDPQGGSLGPRGGHDESAEVLDGDHERRVDEKATRDLDMVTGQDQ